MVTSCDVTSSQNKGGTTNEAFQEQSVGSDFDLF